MPTTIVIATLNPGKVREIEQVLGDLPFTWKTPSDFGDIPPPSEDGSTFAENARTKARYYSRRCGVPALADDSGLEVDALGGEPGIHSARYAGDPCDDAANNAKLIDALRDISPERRTARFRCAIAVADGDRIVAEAAGAVEGLILDLPRGDNGFGYDPHFQVTESGMTAAEMPPQQKNAVSHRGRALRAIRDALSRGVS